MVIIAAACAVVLAACSSSNNTGGTNSTSGAIKPVKSFSAPKDLISFASPQADGSAWILSGTSAAKTIQELNLNSGSLGQPIGVISSAVSIAETYNGMIALGIATPGSGAVELLSSNNPGNVLFTVAVSAPVVEVVPSVDGSEFYALESANNVDSIQTISTASGKVYLFLLTRSLLCPHPIMLRFMCYKAVGKLRKFRPQMGKYFRLLPRALGLKT
jgi:hypothetical protein